MCKDSGQLCWPPPPGAFAQPASREAAQGDEAPCSVIVPSNCYSLRPLAPGHCPWQLYLPLVPPSSPGTAPSTWGHRGLPGSSTPCPSSVSPSVPLTNIFEHLLLAKHCAGHQGVSWIRPASAQEAHSPVLDMNTRVSGVPGRGRPGSLGAQRRGSFPGPMGDSVSVSDLWQLSK